MSKFVPSPEQIARLVASIPEGFIRQPVYSKLFQIKNKGWRNLGQAMRDGTVGYANFLIFDATRLNEATATRMATWCEPSLPALDPHGMVLSPPIVDRLGLREMVFMADMLASSLLRRLSERGLIPEEELLAEAEQAQALAKLLAVGALAKKDRYIYDPLRLSESTIEAILYREALLPMHAAMLAWLAEQPGQAAPWVGLTNQFGRHSRDLIAMGGVSRFSPAGSDEVWLYAAGADEAEAHAAAKKALRLAARAARDRVDAAWGELLAQVGDTVRPDAAEGKSNSAKVAARTYTVKAAARRLSLSEETVAAAVVAGHLNAYYDPKGHTRLSAEQIELAVADESLGEIICAPEPVTVRGVALVAAKPDAEVRRYLLRLMVNPLAPRWKNVRGQLGLPSRYQEFYDLLQTRKEEWRAERRRRDEERAERFRRLQEEERLRREALRRQLLGIFPTWEMVDRQQQRVVLHVGPTNSGKTHDALTHLIAAGTGWYLAPLRLLAFEIFDRLNAQGVPCNLLTGEEHIDIPGATITAATIEMFNPNHSGDCVIIDEAHMFADPDRGAAWTRALMEAQAADLHVLGAPVVRPLIEKMTKAISLPLVIKEHTRLTPIRVADEPWSLRELPSRTIVVAFSRRMVLGLKQELERNGRSVSVVYGNLPPEVRRRQSDRFASGACEICIATDAVGMGLNLPADQVCFYELEKFDGKEVRLLAPHEVQQIGGRAGRYGYSQEGQIGALKWDNLRKLRMLYEAVPQPIDRAHVAPTVEAVTLIPGSLAERLQEWTSLQSIPDVLRASLKTADMTERVELAAMLRDGEVLQLGYAAALKLINAPTRQETREYWRRCASSILANSALPLPALPPTVIRTHRELDQTELCIQEADIYLWLGSRAEFRHCAIHEEAVREARLEWSLRVDDALVNKIDTGRRCAQCGVKLPIDHRFSLCDTCYHGGFGRQQRDKRARHRN